MTALRPEWVAPARTALLVIDIQVDFASPGGALANSGADMTAIYPAVAQAGLLVEAARRAGVACVFSQVAAPDGAIGRAGTPGAEIIEPKPRPDELVVAKPRYSAFTGTGLDEALKARGIDTLVLCGLTTECCVQSTAWDAFERDFRIVIAADAVAAYRADLHGAALEALALSGAVLAQTVQLTAAWK